MMGSVRRMVRHTRRRLPDELWDAPRSLEPPWTVPVVASPGTPMRKTINAMNLFKRASAIWSGDLWAHKSYGGIQARLQRQTRSCTANGW